MASLSSPTFDACALTYKDEIFITLKRNDKEEDTKIWLHSTRCRGVHCDLIGASKSTSYDCDSTRAMTALDSVHALYTEMDHREIMKRLIPYVKQKAKEGVGSEGKFDVELGIMPTKNMTEDEIEVLKKSTSNLAKWFTELKRWFVKADDPTINRRSNLRLILDVYKAGFDGEFRDPSARTCANYASLTDGEKACLTTKLRFHKGEYNPARSPLFWVLGSSQGYTHAYERVMRGPIDVPCRGIEVLSDRVRVSVCTKLGPCEIVSAPLKRIKTTADIAALTAFAHSSVTRTTIACAQKVLNEMISDQETKLHTKCTYVSAAVLHKIASRMTELASTPGTSSPSVPVTEVLNSINSLIMSDWQNSTHGGDDRESRRTESIGKALETVNRVLAEISSPSLTYTQRAMNMMWRQYKVKLEELMKRATTNLTRCDMSPVIAQDSVPKPRPGFRRRFMQTPPIDFGFGSDQSE